MKIQKFALGQGVNGTKSVFSADQSQFKIISIPADGPLIPG